ncbi:MAG: DUF2961 domain-containing protein [Chloroflexi bacterium]|nr:DUF2961 domain-containing protein [Chloroflexota bacterium]
MRQHSTSLKNFWLYVILSEAKNLADSDRVTILFSSLMMLFIISGCSATQAEKPIEFIVPIAEPTRAPATESAPMPAPTAPQKISEYSTLDFLSDYLTNRTYPNLIDAKAWINSSLNLAQWREQNGGTTFWDFWGDDEQWETTNHQWQDDAGAWHLYSRATITARDGKNISAYVLVDRPGPGAMDLLYFVHDTIIWRGDVLQHLAILGARGVEDVVQWGNLQKLGNLRIEVDNEIIFDGAIREWFSGAAQNLSPDLVKIFAWRYQDFGSSGNIIPIPYQQRLRVFLYGGDAKPKWFMATGVTFPRETRVVPYRAADLPIQEFARRALNVLQPETYLDARENVTMRALRAQLDAPARIELNGAGTVEAIQFRIAKNFDPRPLWLRVNHGDETGIDLPFTAFFSDPDQIVAHRSAPIGVMDNGNEYLFYSNFPMPFQNGMTIEISTNRSTAVPITARFARSNELSASQLRVAYTEAEKLRALSPDYQVKIKGDGKLIGIILATTEYKTRRPRDAFVDTRLSRSEFENRRRRGQRARILRSRRLGRRRILFQSRLHHTQRRRESRVWRNFAIQRRGGWLRDDLSLFQ